MIKKCLSIALIIVSILLGMFLGYLQVMPPKAPENFNEDPITIHEADDEADFQLMLTHIREMASEVHSVGSPGIHHTQKYLMDQVKEMGYAYTVDSYNLSMEEVQELLEMWRGYYGEPYRSTEKEIRENAGLGENDLMELNNILVHIDAPDTDETIIFMAHTDSVIQGPGAFDDIVSVAALLEGLRAVQGKETARDLLFLFTDGEEQGLLGSAKFISDHPEYKNRTRLVVNLEARGNSGVLILFQTTDNNLELIKTYRQAVSYPYSMSIATSIYKTMQNDTDLTHFIQAGYPGINFAVIDNPHVYHTELDNYETFSRDSAFHYLTTSVGLVTHLASEPELSLEAEQDSVHFPFFPGEMVLLPEFIANIIAHIVFVLTMLCLFLLWWKKRFAISKFLLTLGAQILVIIFSGGLTWAILEGMYFFHYRYGLFSEVLISENHYGMQSDVLLIIFILFFTVFAVLMLGFIWRRKNQQVSDENHYAHIMGVLLLPALIGEFCVWFFPAGSYLFSIPVLACLLMIAIKLVFPTLTPIFAALSIFITLMLYTPLVYLLHTALLIFTAYVTLPAAFLPLTLISGMIEFTLKNGIAEENSKARQLTEKTNTV